MSGEFVTELPPHGRDTAHYDWDALAVKAQSNPGGLLLAAKQVPLSLIKSLRQRNRAPFVMDGGTLAVIQRNTTHVVADGKTYADVYLKWTTDQSTPELKEAK